MLKWILLLLLLTPFSGFSQEKYTSAIRPFEDYGQCRTGFINYLGDTVWQAEFSSVVSEKYPKKHWLVEKEGFFGILDNYGNVLVEPIMDKLQFDHQDGVTYAWRDGKVGIFDHDYNWLLQQDYDAISLVGCQGEGYTFVNYLFSQNGDWGVMDDTFRVIVPPQFDTVSVFYEVDFDSDECTNYAGFVVGKGGYYGVINRQGEEIISKSYRKITPKFYSNRWDSDVYFIVENDEHQVKIINHDRSEVVPYSDTVIVYSSEGYRDRCNRELNIRYGFTQRGDSVRVYNLFKGTKSKWYSNLGQHDSDILFMDDRGWGVLDSNFEEVYSGGKGLPSMCNGFIHTIDWLNGKKLLTQAYDREYRYKYEGQVLCSWKDFVWESRPEVTGDSIFTGKSLSQNVIHIKSGKKLPVEYDRIYVRNYYNETYFWALDTLGEFLKIDVYDTNMMLKASIDSIQNNYKKNSNSDVFKYDFLTDFYSILTASNGKKGLVMIDGRIALDFRYDMITDAGLFRESETEVRNLMLTFNDSLYALIDDSGKQFLTSRFGISRQNDGWLEVGKPYSKFYNSQLELVLDNISDRIYIHDENSRDGIQTSMYQRDIFYISDGYLYLPKNGGFTLMDHKYLPFDETIIIFRKQVLLHKSGKVLFAAQSSKHPRIYRNPSGYVGEAEGVLVFLDKKGNELNRIEEISEQSKQYGEYVLKLSTGERGVIDIGTGLWNVKPTSKYERIQCAEVNKRRDHFLYWVQLKNRKWHLLKMNGDLLLDVEFDYPTLDVYGDVFIGSVNLNYGIFDATGNQIAPFEVEKVHLFNYHIFYKVGEQWHILKQMGNYIFEAVPQSFDRLVTPRGDADNVIAFRNDSVAAFDHQLNLKVPWESVEAVINDSVCFDSKLRRLTRINRNSAIYNRVYNKVLFDSYGLYTLSSNILGSDGKADEELGVTLNYQLVGGAADRWFTVVYSSTKQYQNYGSHTDSKYYQYEWKKDSLVQMTPSQIFQDPNLFHRTLDSLLSAEIQSKQLYGVVCPNLPTILEEMKKNMVFSNDGLSFFDRQRVHALIRWEDLYEFLKPDCQISVDQLIKK